MSGCLEDPVTEGLNLAKLSWSASEGACAVQASLRK